MFHNISYANPAAATKVRKLEPRTAPARLDTPTDLSAEGVREISAALNALIADTLRST